MELLDRDHRRDGLSVASHDDRRPVARRAQHLRPWRRPQAQLVRRIESYGGHVVGARAFANPGREPSRTFSLCAVLVLEIELGRDGMRVELDAHVGTMHAETELAAARAEVEEHVAMMGSMVDDMGGMLDRTHCGGW